MVRLNKSFLFAGFLLAISLLILAIDSTESRRSDAYDDEQKEKHAHKVHGRKVSSRSQKSSVDSTNPDHNTKPPMTPTSGPTTTTSGPTTTTNEPTTTTTTTTKEPGTSTKKPPIRTKKPTTDDPGTATTPSSNPSTTTTTDPDHDEMYELLRRQRDEKRILDKISDYALEWDSWLKSYNYRSLNQIGALKTYNRFRKIYKKMSMNNHLKRVFMEYK